MSAKTPKAVPTPPGASASFNGHAAGPATRLTAPPVPVQAAAPRRWTAKGFAAAVICVLLGGLILMYAVPAYSKRHTVIVVARPVQVGTAITAADLTTASITSDPALTPIPANDQAGILGKLAMVTLRPGTLLTRTDVGTSDGFVSGQVLVPLGLKPEQFPGRGLAAGDHVLVVAMQVGGAAPPAASTGDIRATVADVGANDPSSDQTVVDLRVPAADGPTVARLGATGNVIVLLLPPGS